MVLHGNFRHYLWRISHFDIFQPIDRAIKTTSHSGHSGRSRSFIPDDREIRTISVEAVLGTQSAFSYVASKARLARARKTRRHASCRFCPEAGWDGIQPGLARHGLVAGCTPASSCRERNDPCPITGRPDRFSGTDWRRGGDI